MPETPTAEDLYKYIAKAFERAKSDPELAKKVSAAPGVIKVLVTEPDGCMLIDMPNMSALPASKDAKADATLSMTGQFANRYWQGDLNLTNAMMKGDIAIDGNMTLVAKAVPAQMKLFPTYIEMLRNDGRTDLLVK